VGGEASASRHTPEVKGDSAVIAGLVHSLRPTSNDPATSTAIDVTSSISSPELDAILRVFQFGEDPSSPAYLPTLVQSLTSLGLTSLPIFQIGSLMSKESASRDVKNQKSLSSRRAAVGFGITRVFDRDIPTHYGEQRHGRPCCLKARAMLNMGISVPMSARGSNYKSNVLPESDSDGDVTISTRSPVISPRSTVSEESDTGFSTVIDAENTRGTSVVRSDQDPDRDTESLYRHLANGIVMDLDIADLEAIARREIVYDLVPVVYGEWADINDVRGRPKLKVAFTFMAPQGYEQQTRRSQYVTKGLKPRPGYYELCRDAATLKQNSGEQNEDKLFQERWMRTMFMYDIASESTLVNMHYWQNRIEHGEKDTVREIPWLSGQDFRCYGSKNKLLQLLHFDCVWWLIRSIFLFCLFVSAQAKAQLHKIDDLARMLKSAIQPNLVEHVPLKYKVEFCATPGRTPGRCRTRSFVASEPWSARSMSSRAAASTRNSK